MNRQRLDIPNDEDNQFLTLWTLILMVPVGTLADAIEQDGIYTRDRFGRFGLADKEGKEKALHLLTMHHEWVSTPPEEKSSDPRSLTERWGFPGDNAYEHFGWPAKMVPGVLENWDTLIDAEEDETKSPTDPNPPGHLNHDPEMQNRANQIAAERLAATGRPITRNKVAKLLAKELEMGEETVLRRIRKQWK